MRKESDYKPITKTIMLATIIILAIIVAIAVVVFAIKAANLSHQIEDIYAKQAILHDKYCNHEDRIDGNYKSLAELNRRQDEWQRQHKNSDAAIYEGLASLRERVERLEQQPAPIAKTSDAAMERRAQFAALRETLSVREAAREMGVSLTTAKRYEQWRKANERE